MDYLSSLKFLRDGVEDAIYRTHLPNKDSITIDALAHLHCALSHLRAAVSLLDNE